MVEPEEPKELEEDAAPLTGAKAASKASKRVAFATGEGLQLELGRCHGERDAHGWRPTSQELF